MGAEAPTDPEHGGSSPTAKRGSTANKSYSPMVFLTLIPWLVFGLFTLMWLLLYHHAAIFVWAALLAGVGIVFANVWPRGQYGLAILLIISFVLSVVIGTYMHHTYMEPYWACRENREYNNIVPTEPAASHSDAGKISFTADSRVDVLKSVGYKLGSTYCVAPVMDDNSGSRVEYWAAGVDCCASREDMWCDEVRVESARSGVVVASQETWMDQFVYSDRAMFVKAARVATAQYDLAAAEEPIFVRWVARPDLAQTEYFTHGGIFWVVAVLIYLVVSIVLAFVVVEASDPKGAEG
mmetsp:Transcript_37219/g.89492  ORF Transcript_37219/g.89492 Transcript_37219/m.89492 type:complete len:295 (-) Transcript_37219:25-909(-)